MKPIKSAKNYISYSFLGLLILTVIFNFLGFSIISLFTIISYNLILFTLMFMTLLNYYLDKNIKLNSLMIIVIPIIPLLLFRDIDMIIILFIYLVAIIPLLFKKTSDKLLKILGVSYYIVAIFICIAIIGLNIFFADFGEGKTRYSDYSPDKKGKLTVIDVDQGALGGNTIVKVERNIYGIFKWEKTAYIGGYEEHPRVMWEDNSKYLVNGESKKIYFVLD